MVKHRTNGPIIGARTVRCLRSRKRRAVKGDQTPFSAGAVGSPHRGLLNRSARNRIRKLASRKGACTDAPCECGVRE